MAKEYSCVVRYGLASGTDYGAGKAPQGWVSYGEEGASCGDRGLLLR